MVDMIDEFPGTPDDVLKWHREPYSKYLLALLSQSKQHLLEELQEVETESELWRFQGRLRQLNGLLGILETDRKVALHDSQPEQQ